MPPPQKNLLLFVYLPERLLSKIHHWGYLSITNRFSPGNRETVNLNETSRRIINSVASPINTKKRKEGVRKLWQFFP